MMTFIPGKDGSKVTTVVATPGQGPDRPQEVSYADMKLIGNGSFGVVYQAKLCDTGELIAIKKVLQDKRFKVSYFTLLVVQVVNYRIFFYLSKYSLYFFCLIKNVNLISINTVRITHVTD